MTANLFKCLFMDADLTDNQMREIPHYRAELHFHVLYKTAQMGCIMGMGVVGPLYGLFKGRSFAAVKKYAVKGGKVGCGVLMPLSPLMTEAAIRNADEEAVYDRSYRIRYNKGQMRADRFATFGGVAGLGASAALGAGALPGLMAGFGLGTVAAGAYTASLSNKSK